MLSLGQNAAGRLISSFYLASTLARGAHDERPFAMFRGDVRKPVRRRAAMGQAGKRRLAAMSISPAHGSSVRKLYRAQRILLRVMKDDPETAKRFAAFVTPASGA